MTSVLSLLRAALLAAVLLVGCTTNNDTTWDDVTPSPGADAYEGDVLGPLAVRLSSLVTERALTLIDSRVEYLPAGVTWTDHLEFRTQNVGDLQYIEERIPEPDRPVLIAEYRADNKTVLVIANADEAGERLVVLTALTST